MLQYLGFEITEYCNYIFRNGEGNIREYRVLLNGELACSSNQPPLIGLACRFEVEKNLSIINK